MKYKSYNGIDEIKLLSCPFCGHFPIIKYIGNDYTKNRKIEIKCPNCRIKRVDASKLHNFYFLEKVMAKLWNKREKAEG